MAPCCWSGTVYDHGNSEMEKEIEALVLKGKPREEILNYFVNEKQIVMSDGRRTFGYGERILAVPTASGFNLLAWLMPATLGIAAILIIGFTMKKRPHPAITVKQPKQSDIPFNDTIEKELKELD